MDHKRKHLIEDNEDHETRGRKSNLAAMIFWIALVCLIVLGKLQLDEREEANQALQGAVDEAEYLLENRTEQVIRLTGSIEEKNDRISEQEEQIEEQEAWINNLQNECMTYYLEMLRLYEEVEFYEVHSGIVEENGDSNYHVYGCPKLKEEGYYIYNTAWAESEGYHACPDCH